MFRLKTFKRFKCHYMQENRKQKKRKTEKHLEKRSFARGKEYRKDLGRTEDGCKRQEEMESSRDRPMSPLRRSGLSQVSYARKRNLYIVYL